MRTSTYQVSQGATSKSFTYDADGNMTSDGTRTYEWDAENRLVAVREGAATVASYSYGAQKLRISKTVGGQTWSYVYDDSQNVVEGRLSSGAVQLYLHGSGIDEPLGMVAGGVASYFTADHLGSVVAKTDGGGSELLGRLYDAWGHLLAGVTDAGPAFTGKEWDPEVGLYYYRARYYSPTQGRFISEDPAGLADGALRYSYVRNRPLTWRDPLGLFRVRGFDASDEHDLLTAARFVGETLSQKPCCAGSLGDKLLEYLHDDRLVFERGEDLLLDACGQTPLPVVFTPEELKEWPIKVSKAAWDCCSNLLPPTTSLASTIIHELVHIGRPLTMHAPNARQRLLPFKVAYDCFGCERPEYPPK